MGKKEREKKAAKRALAELGQTATPCKAAALAPKTPAAKRRASVGKARAKALEDEPWQLVQPDTTTTAAGSGNPASNVSSGGVEAEVKVVIPTGEGGAKGKS